MARYDHLPIYKTALDVAVGFEKLVAGFSRYHKYTLGTELRNGSRRVVEQIVRANSARSNESAVAVRNAYPPIEWPLSGDDSRSGSAMEKNSDSLLMAVMDSYS
jgi:hypothetical protein